MTPTQPNLLLLVVDQERRWELTFPLVPAALQEKLLSLLPAHQWLAQNGVSFANHYASGIPCSPANETQLFIWLWPQSSTAAAAA